MSDCCDHQFASVCLQQIKYLHVLVKGLLATMKMVDEGHVHVSMDSFTVQVPAHSYYYHHHIKVKKI